MENRRGHGTEPEELPQRMGSMRKKLRRDIGSEAGKDSISEVKLLLTGPAKPARTDPLLNHPYITRDDSHHLSIYAGVEDRKQNRDKPQKDMNQINCELAKQDETSSGASAKSIRFPHVDSSAWGKGTGRSETNGTLVAHSKLGTANSAETMDIGSAGKSEHSTELEQLFSHVSSSPPDTFFFKSDEERPTFNSVTSSGDLPSISHLRYSSGEPSRYVIRKSKPSFQFPENLMFESLLGAGLDEMENLMARLPCTHSCSLNGEPEGQITSYFSQEPFFPEMRTNVHFANRARSSNLPFSFTSSHSSRKANRAKKAPKPPFQRPISSFINIPSGESFQVSKRMKQEQKNVLASTRPRKRLQDDALKKQEHGPMGDHSVNKYFNPLNRPYKGALTNKTQNNSETTVQMTLSEADQFAKQQSRKFKKQKTECMERIKKDTTSLFPHQNQNSGKSDCLLPNGRTAIQCKHIPYHLNNKVVLKKYFSQFGKVQAVHIKRNKYMAVIYFGDHVSAGAALAKEKGKRLHRNIIMFWHNQKSRIGKEEYLTKGKKIRKKNKSEEENHQNFPLQKPLVKSFGDDKLPSKSLSLTKLELPKGLNQEADPFSCDEQMKNSERVRSAASGVSGLMSITARTSEEKYRLLNQRDKIIRLVQVKRTDLDKAKPIVGTCPDMCPEKERYLRESRKQLSIFELLPGTDKVDHTAAIKEYSRSSADQEEPLPHDLRPSSVLSMTMDYLITHVMNKMEGNTREWYDFIWNRTRGVRKDITQQNLCDPLTVSLLEKCMRFHIHCAHQLCEEPIASFDAKINNENVIKCLQTLKEMYQDLANMDIYCKSEAEFRAYSVLLNLNNENVLRELQQFQPTLYNSPEVVFASQALTALSTNNFVKFFKLVQTASYLNSCILHGYFNQVRRNALKILNTAYTVNSQRSTTFPLRDLVHMLLFRDDKEATDFVTYYGLHVSNGWVHLNRLRFKESKRFFKPKISAFIKEKLTGSIGEIINGGPLPSVIQHIPVCSFNKQSIYTGENSEIEPSNGDQKTNLNMTGLPKRSKGDLGEVGHPDCLPLVLPWIPPPSACDSLPRSPFRGRSQKEHPQQPPFGFQSQPRFHHPLSISAPPLAPLPSEQPPQRLAQPAVPSLNAYLELDVEEVVEELVQDIVEEECQEIINVSSALGYAPKKGQRAQIFSCPEETCVNLVTLFLEDEIFQTARETLQEFQHFRRCLWRWRNVVINQKKIKRKLRVFPAAPCFVDNTNKLKALLPSAECPITKEYLSKGILDLGHAGKLGISCIRLNRLRNEMIHQMKVQYFYQKLLREASWSPLDLPSLISEHLALQREHVFWKVVLVLPDSEMHPSGDLSRILGNWLKVKFMGAEISKEITSNAEDKIQTLALLQYINQQEGWATHVNVCVKVVQGILNDAELEVAKSQRDFLGTSGFILLLPVREKNEDTTKIDESWISALLQLKKLLQAKPVLPVIPLIILVPIQGKDEIEKDVEKGLMLQDLISSELISDYIIVKIPSFLNDLEANLQVSKAVKWLASHSPCHPKLCCQTLIQFVEDGVHREFSQRFFWDRKERRLAGLASQKPGPIIDLYNSVLQFLAEAISSGWLSNLSWPVTEFAEPGGTRQLPHLYWNTPQHLAWLKEAVLSLQIPQIDIPPSAPWNCICTTIFQYASQIPSSHQTQPVLQVQVEDLLSRVYFKLKDKELASSGEGGFSVKDIPWDAIISLCINHRLKDWMPLTLPIMSEALSRDGEICVYFSKEHLKKFIRPSAWEQARLRTQKEIQQSYECSESDSKKTLKLNDALGMILEQNDACVHLKPGKKKEYLPVEASNPSFSIEKLLSARLSTCLRQERQESKRFEDQIQQWLTEESGQLEMSLPQQFTLMPQSIALLVKSAALTELQVTRQMENTQSMQETGTSLSKRLRRLENLIRATKEEDRIFELQLSTLRDLGGI
ncbi:germinal-center associated nuclear protein-like [Tachyglossus aculeatus]|uniref:germinal-center associated nuclear protein-like n=1 Tax=Tachyglossus aculeatus TaxID=9261 RepID=UPI0018F3BB8D|nr:germinal-center associated nuclear protein-like [Tachyglossus aculeatus]